MYRCTLNSFEDHMLSWCADFMTRTYGLRNHTSYRRPNAWASAGTLVAGDHEGLALHKMRYIVPCSRAG